MSLIAIGGTFLADVQTTIKALGDQNKTSDLIDLHRELGIALFGVANIPAAPTTFDLPTENDGTSRLEFPFVAKPGMNILSLSVGQLAKNLVRAGYQHQMRNQLNELAPMLPPMPSPPPHNGDLKSLTQAIYEYRSAKHLLRTEIERVYKTLEDGKL